MLPWPAAFLELIRLTNSGGWSRRRGGENNAASLLLSLSRDSWTLLDALPADACSPAHLTAVSLKSLVRVSTVKEVPPPPHPPLPTTLRSCHCHRDKRNLRQEVKCCVCRVWNFLDLSFLHFFVTLCVNLCVLGRF